VSEKSLLYYRTLCDKSFFFFVKTIGGSVMEGGGDATRLIHKPLCDFWQDQTSKRVAIFMPRGWFKSSLFTKWGALWLYLQNNESRILIASENALIASRFMSYIKRQILGNELLRRIYPELKQVDATWAKSSLHRWSDEQCDLPRIGIYSEATITAIGVSGAAQSGHYSHALIDDLIGKSAMESPIVMEGVLRWQDNVKELLVNPNHLSPSGSIIRIVGTHYSAGDYGCYVQEKYPEYKWMIVPALKDDSLKDTQNILWLQNPEAEVGESNWIDSPDNKYDTAHYIDMKANPEQELIFYSQHQNNPHRGSGFNKFELDWIRYFRFEDREGKMFIVLDDNEDEVYPMAALPLYGMIDPGGFSETRLIKKGSRNAVLVGGQLPGSIKKFVVYTWAGRLKEPEAFIDEIFKANKLVHPRGWRIEPFAQQQYIYKDILEARRKKGIALSISLMPFDVTKNVKDDDIQALINPFFNGEVYLHRSMRELIAEIRDYPKGLTCDLLDMLGKINKLYWTRKPMRKQLPYGSMEADRLSQDRSAITGY